MGFVEIDGSDYNQLKLKFKHLFELFQTIRFSGSFSPP